MQPCVPHTALRSCVPHVQLRSHPTCPSCQVVLYLTRVLADPKMIYLCSRCKPSQRVPEMVEADMAVGEVKRLLESRNLAGSFALDAPLLAKRQDGSTILISINPMEGLTQLQGRIAAHEVSSHYPPPFATAWCPVAGWLTGLAHYRRCCRAWSPRC